MNDIETYYIKVALFSAQKFSAWIIPSQDLRPLKEITDRLKRDGLEAHVPMAPSALLGWLENLLREDGMERSFSGTGDLHSLSYGLPEQGHLGAPKEWEDLKRAQEYRQDLVLFRLQAGGPNTLLTASAKIDKCWWHVLYLLFRLHELFPAMTTSPDILTDEYRRLPEVLGAMRTGGALSEQETPWPGALKQLGDTEPASRRQGDPRTPTSPIRFNHWVDVWEAIATDVQAGFPAMEIHRNRWPKRLRKKDSYETVLEIIRAGRARRLDNRVQ